MLGPTPEVPVCLENRARWTKREERTGCHVDDVQPRERVSLSALGGTSQGAGITAVPPVVSDSMKPRILSLALWSWRAAK
jgi:hypothetical protein